MTIGLVFLCLWFGGVLYALGGSLMMALNHVHQGAARSVIMALVWPALFLVELIEASFNHNQDDDAGGPKRWDPEEK